MGTSEVRSSGLEDAPARCSAVEPTAVVRDRIPIEASVKAAGDVADMRRCQQVRRRGTERMVERQRLLVQDIDGYAGDLFVFKLERLNQPVQQDAIKAPVMPSNAVPVVFVEGVHERHPADPSSAG
jgi:hypothetical protein